jgi:hypothetical protein
MSLCKSKCWCSNNSLHFLKHNLILNPNPNLTISTNAFPVILQGAYGVASDPTIIQSIFYSGNWQLSIEVCILGLTSAEGQKLKSFKM